MPQITTNTGTYTFAEWDDLYSIQVCINSNPIAVDGHLEMLIDRARNAGHLDGRTYIGAETRQDNGYIYEVHHWLRS